MGGLGVSRSLPLALILVLLVALVGAYLLYYLPQGTTTETTVITVITETTTETVTRTQQTTSPPPLPPPPTNTPTTSPPSTTVTSTPTTSQMQTLPTYTPTQTTAPTTTPPPPPTTSPPSTTSSSYPTLTATTFTTTSPTTTTTTTGGILNARLISPSKLWFTAERMGKILEYDASTDSVRVVYGDSSVWMSSITPHPEIAEKIYYAGGNKNKIFLRLTVWTTPGGEVVYEHRTYVKCVRFGPDSGLPFRLYFSEASGAGGDGVIYKLVKDAEVYMTVRIREIGGYWAGHFEFAPDGTLYLSNGNVIPSSIYAYRQGRFVKLVTFGSPVMGMDYVSNARLSLTESPGGQVTVRRGLLFADHGSSIYLYDLDTGATYRVFSDPSYGSSFVTDVAVAP